MASEARAVTFSSALQPAYELEGRLHLPANQTPSLAVVIAHPHPLWGGSMAAGVVIQMAHTLAERGCAALRFNFRGVGQSQGSHDKGCGEVNDVIGALDFISNIGAPVHTAPLALAGYSFGAWTAGQATIRDDRVRAFAAVALPMSRPYFVDLSQYRLPKCFVTGSRDTISPPELLRQYVGTLPEPRFLHVIPDADHYLLGFEQEAAAQITDCLLSATQ